MFFFSSSCLLGLEFPLGLLVVLCRVDTVLVVVDKVEPGHHVDPDTRVAGLTRGNALHVLGQLALAVELLAALDLVDHLAHVHVDFATVLGEAVETVYYDDCVSQCLPSIWFLCLSNIPSSSCREGEIWSGERTDGSGVAEVETGKETDTTGKTHNTGENAAGDTGRRNALHEGHGSGDGGAESDTVQVVARTGIAENALEVTEKTIG